MTEPSASLRAMAQARVPPASALDAQGVVEVVGPDLDAMLSFYSTLGFRIERRAGQFAVVVGFGVRLFLAQNREAPAAKRWANIRILVADVDELWDCVNALGLPLGNTVGDRDYGLRDFLVVDPAGFEIRFAQVLAGRREAGPDDAPPRLRPPAPKTSVRRSLQDPPAPS